MFTAWNTARLTAYSGKKLSPLGDELARLRPRQVRKQTADEMIEAMRAIKAMMGDSAPDKIVPASQRSSQS